MTHVDAHQHFWHPARNDYPWMPPADPVLTKPYTPSNLENALQATGIKQTILVQAAPTVAETDYLLGIADATPYVAKVVGWINFEDPSQLETLKRFSAHPKFAGVRPMIQDIPDENWMLREDVQWAFQAIIDLDLTFDCLGFPQHLNNFHTLLTRYADMRAVIDHCMKPLLREPGTENFQLWSHGMTRLAEDTNAYCKLSGLITETDGDWSARTLRPYTDHVIAAFGAERIMWGSDWPVARLRCEYEQWHRLALELTDTLASSERSSIFGGTATTFYRI